VPEEISLSPREVADRAGVGIEAVQRLIDAGAIKPSAAGGLTPIDVRKARVVELLVEGGIPFDAFVLALERGLLNLDWLAQPEYERFAGLGPETFAQVVARTGVPLSVLEAVREAMGLPPPRADERVRDDERRVIPFLETQVQLGFQPEATERYIRAIGDNTRRIADAEAQWYHDQVTVPRLAASTPMTEFDDPDASARLAMGMEAAVLAIWQANAAHTWLANILGIFEFVLRDAGLYEAPERQPAICFLDITGYTRLTQERGDRAAADLAERLSRLVQRSSVAHGGRPVKWLGDGVMFWFRDPGPAIVAALDMVDGVVAAGLPPAHVGIHTGPVIAQQGDFYGQTVNLAARIAEYARPGEVLVTRTVKDAAGAPDGIAFTAIGPVDLKGVTGGVELHAARRA
jgi:adenylate cyclase